ncbi:unnamed protein product [Calypogeia fissa]
MNEYSEGNNGGSGRERAAGMDSGGRDQIYVLGRGMAEDREGIAAEMEGLKAKGMAQDQGMGLDYRGMAVSWKEMDEQKQATSLSVKRRSDQRN